MNISLAGCGFLGIYHIGVASCVKEYAPSLYTYKIAGASAGAICAAALLCGCPLGEGTTQVLQVAVKARSRALGPLHPSFNIVETLRQGLEKILPGDAHIRCSDRLYISLTRVSDCSNELVCKYYNKKDLIQALLCSSFIPGYSGVIPLKFHGERYFDGSFSNNLPRLDKHTITVSPFCGESDICPRDDETTPLQIFLANTSINLNLHNLSRFGRILFPAHPDLLSELCKQGFNDTLRFLHRNNLISCTRCLSLSSSIAFESGKTDTTSDSALSRDSEDAYENQGARPKKYDEVCGKLSKRNSNLMPSSITEEAFNSVQGGSVQMPNAIVDDDQSSVGTNNSCETYSSNVNEGREMPPVPRWSVGQVTGFEQPCVGCSDCKTLQHVALQDQVPDSIIGALRAAAEKLDKGIINYVFNSRIGKFISILLSPYYLPFEVTFLNIMRFCKMLPHMRETLTDNIEDVSDAVHSVFSFFNKKRHRFSAKFTYELAITEIDRSEIEQLIREAHEFDRMTASQYACSVDEDQEFEEVVIDDGDQKIVTSKKVGDSMKLNIDFNIPEDTVDGRFKSKRQRRQAKIENALRSDSPATVLPSQAAIDISNKVLAMEHQRILENEDFSSNGTLDQALTVPEHSNAIFSFSYHDNKSNTVKVTQVYDISDESTNVSPEQFMVNEGLEWEESWNDLKAAAKKY